MPTTGASGPVDLGVAQDALLAATEALSDARNRAARAKHSFVRARKAEEKKRARRSVEEALGDLRAATLEYEAATYHLRRAVAPGARRALDELLRRLARRDERYEETSRILAEATAAYENARGQYARERAALGRARVPPTFDEVFARLESALAGRDKAIAEVHAAHRETLTRLRAAMNAHDTYARKPAADGRAARDAAWAEARAAFADSERRTASLTDSLDRWFEADKEFGLSVAALEARRGVPEVHRLQVRALDVLRASARLTLASVLADEAMGALAATIGEVKNLR